MVYEYYMYDPFLYGGSNPYQFYPYTYAQDMYYYPAPFSVGGAPIFPNGYMQYVPFYETDVTRQPNVTQQVSNSTNPSVMQQFLNEHGQVDIQKMLATVGQLADTVQQVTPVVRQLNDLIRAMRA